ncbi:MAG: flagellar hook-basal body complex protein [Rhodobacteraceae bacterium]|nr:flagellar hook-basal body complex protein [Paracoccaceae bacterium]
METAGYVTLSRQTGLWKEMQVVANNVANISTTGFRREGVVFTEMIQALPNEGGGVAMAAARARFSDPTQGSVRQTGNPMDLAIQGRGYFMVETPEGNRLTRAGAFALNTEGEMVNPDGLRLLDAGGAPIFIPPDAAAVTIAQDGTVSAGGNPLAQVGIYNVADDTGLTRQYGTLFDPGDQEPLAAVDPVVLQGFIEGSNVNPVTEMARMIEVQRTYEMGMKFLENEDNRIRNVTRTLGQRA